MLRDDQIGLLRWVLAACAPASGDLPPPPDLDLPRLQAAGLATGLTAAIGALAAERGVALPETWQAFVDDQVAVVAGRRRRYAALLPRVLTILDAAGVGAVPVKGAVLADAVWPVPDARPMSDLDLLVRQAERERAVTALRGAGFALERRAPGEDTFLAWGDGRAIDVDRESAAHSGKVELHPGWIERVHHYEIDDGGWLLGVAEPGRVAGARCRVLPFHALAVQALGHLSVGVIRAEVRAVNVVDVALLLARFDARDADAFEAACSVLDPRLTAPGLWLVDRARPARGWPRLDLDAIAAGQIDRLPHVAAERLGRAQPRDVLRELGARTSIRWRLAFATTAGERAGVLRQGVSPSARELADEGGSPWSQQRVRAGRAVRRVRRRVS